MMNCERKEIIREEIVREKYIIIPALKEESIIVPTATITKAGPAFTEDRTILFASFFVILFCEMRAAAMDEPTGKPPHSPKKITPPALPDILKIFLKNLSVFLPKNSETPLETAKEETTRKGKSEGIIVPAQISSPVLIPSAES